MRLIHWLASLLVTVACATVQAGTLDYTTYYHNDHLGSPAAATDESGDVLWRAHYRPYGERQEAPKSANFGNLGYTGHAQAPDSQLVYAGARYYDPLIGRFLAVDPAPVMPGAPGSFNRFNYAANNPYRYNDPSGQIPIDTVWDFGNVVYDLGKAAVGAATGNSAMVAEGLGDAALDTAAMAVPYLPAGSAKLARMGLDKVDDVAKNTVGELRAAGKKDAHHIIQDAAVRDLPGYNTNAAPGVQLLGPSNVLGTPHNLATKVQRQAGGGTYAAERRIGYKALRRAGATKEDARAHISNADEYFRGVGVESTTPTRIPGNR